MTPHIKASRGDVAETILLPGDPLRARFIAENFLQEVHLYNEVRGMLGFTGLYKGERVSVQGTGMGSPSVSIYVHELIEHFGAKQLIRVGSCGAYQEKVKVNDLILAMSASTNSSINRRKFQGMDYAPTADFSLLEKAWQNSAKENIHVGQVLTSDWFYEDDSLRKAWAQYGVLAVEMETAALYTLAARFGVKALTILTVSDSLVTGEALSPEDRETSFTRMFELALSLL